MCYDNIDNVVKIKYCMLVMYFFCRYFNSQYNCYKYAIEETCDTSAIHENVLKTIGYYAKLWVVTSCELGE